MKLVIDGKKIISVDDVHSIFSDRLSFPDYYGRNFDALYDLLTSYKKKLDIKFKNIDSFKSALSDKYDILCSLLADVCESCHNITFVIE